MHRSEGKREVSMVIAFHAQLEEQELLPDETRISSCAFVLVGWLVDLFGV